MKIKKQLFLPAILFLLFLFSLAPVKAIDTGCSEQTPTCLGTSVVDLYLCNGPFGYPGSRYCVDGNASPYSQQTVRCNSDCAFSVCSSNDDITCTYYSGTVGGEFYEGCQVGGCTNVGNCCGGAGATPTPVPGATSTPIPTSTPLPLPGCSNWTSIYINDCSQAEYNAPRNPDCITQTRSVTLHLSSSNAAKMSFANVDPTAACADASYTYGPYTYAASRAWTLTTGYGLKKVCAKFTNATGDSKCGARIEYAAPTPTPTPISPTPTPTSIPSCTLSLTPATATIAVGGTRTLTASLSNVQNGSVSSVTFTSSNISKVTVDFSVPPPGAPYTTTVTGVAPPGATITAKAFMSGVARCTDTSVITVTGPTPTPTRTPTPTPTRTPTPTPTQAPAADPWWQVKDGDVQTNGDLDSSVPATATYPYFDLEGLGGFPGVAKYWGSTSHLTLENVSVMHWKAKSRAVPSKIQDYAYFRRLVPSSDVVLNPVSLFPSGGTASEDGYYWYEYDGAFPFSITSNISLVARKVILLVAGPGLDIGGKITYSPGEGIFVALVDGDINILGDVGNAAAPNFDLMGFFLADGNISTGDSTNSFRFKGSMVAWGGLNLERHLVPSLNPTKASEIFEYDPASAFLFPSKLQVEKTKWKEVAP